MSRTHRPWILGLAFLLVGALLFGLLRQKGAKRESTRPAVEEVQPPTPASVPNLTSSEDSPKSRQAAVGAEPEAEPVVPAEPEPELAPLPSGLLEVHVFFESDGLALTPLSGTSVRIAPSRDVFRTGAPPLLEPDEVTAERAVGPDGVALFQELPQGDWYVEARSPTGAVRWASVQLKKDEGARILLRFGTGRVYGAITDEETGEPIRYAAIRLGLEPSVQGSLSGGVPQSLVRVAQARSSISVITGEDGLYEFDELSAGAVSIWLEPAAYDPEARTYTFLPRRFVYFDLEPEEERRFDFPDPAGAIWTGRIMSRTGEPVVDPAGDTAHLDVRSEGSVRYRQVQSAQADGSFRVHLPAGTYEVVLESPFNSEEVHPLGDERLELEAGRETRRDLVLPGTRVRARVVDESGAPLRGQRGFPVAAHPKGQTHSAVFYSSELSEDGTFVLDGLGPGEWIIGAGRKGDSVNLTVDKTDLELNVTITVP